MSNKIDNEQFSLADLFGDESLAFQPKQPEKKAEKLTAKKATAKKDVVSLPTTVYSEVFAPVEISAETLNLSPDTAEVDLDDFKTHLMKVHSEWATNLIKLDFPEKGKVTVYPALNYSYTVTGDTGIDATGWIIACNGIVKTLDSETITKDALSALWESEYPEFKGCRYFYDMGSKVISPVFKAEKSDITLPIKVKIFGGEEFVLTEELYKEQTAGDTEDESDDKSEEESDETDAAASGNTDGVVVKSSDICAILEKRHGLSFGVQRVTVEKETLLMAFASKEFAAMTPPEKKDEEFPSDSTVSLFYTRFPITSADFKGKKKITAKELIRYLRDVKGCIEYTEDSSIIKYDKAANLIKVAPGQYAKKGAGELFF